MCCFDCSLKTFLFHRLSINRPTKHGKENSLSDGHCECQKEMNDQLVTGVLIIFDSEPHSAALLMSQHHFEHERQ
jgi:hypothetical protein